jgi:aminoglycoside phosphotransferase (APT) family kinase protein
MTDTTKPLGIEPEAIEAWLANHVAQARPPLRYTLIAGGHSNLTYRLEDASGHRFALRRPPLGDYPRGAHDVLREHRILHALRGTKVPVPPVVTACEDTNVTGAPFYVMDWVDGEIVDRPSRVADVLPDAAARRRAAESLVDALADLHLVDIDAVGLGDLGPREEQLARQIERLRRVWEKTQTRELPIIEAIRSRLLAARPRQRHTGLVHSDYRAGNVILAADGTVAAILDWELCALGDVLIDVGGLLANWDEPDDDWPDIWMQRAPTRAGGFPTKRELIARYAERTGFEVRDVDYYRAFSYWRLAVIAEGMKRRYETGALAAQGVDVSAIAQRVVDRAQMAERCLDLAGS